MTREFIHDALREFIVNGCEKQGVNKQTTSNAIDRWNNNDKATGLMEATAYNVIESILADMNKTKGEVTP